MVANFITRKISLWVGWTKKNENDCRNQLYPNNMLYKPICEWDKKEAYLIQMFDEFHCWALRPKVIYLQQVLKKQA